LTDEQLKIAVFIDFDNIEIGVKTTLNATFDVGTILEAIKERGEVVTKVAYGDWKRAGDHSRMLTQHAIRMVQRNVTPGGDKNGADINLALDALEMALTHEHINAFVIVGGDSDFISLVEKLKQYDKKVLVVGGRAFTSVILQKNCHEFIAYENLMTPQAGGRRAGGRARPAGGQPAGQATLSDAFPLVRRALVVLSEREVSPQLGLFKSTLLQLDSTFSEREYGTGSFRDFAEKLAEAGLVTLKQAGRSLLVELKDTDPAPAEGRGRRSSPTAPAAEPKPAVAEPSSAAQPEAAVSGRQQAAAPGTPAGQPADAVRAVQRIFESVATPPRWPMYVRNVKQILRSMEPGFDERRYGFAGILDLLRACQRDGLLRLDRDRQGVLRVFSGPALQRPAGAAPGTAPAGVITGGEPFDARALPGDARAGVVAGGVAPKAASPVEAVAGDVESVVTTPAEGEGEEGEPARPPAKPRRRPAAPRAAVRKASPARKPRAPRAKVAKKSEE